MDRSTIAFLVLGALAGAGAVRAGEPLRLDEAIARALRQSPTLEAAAAEAASRAAARRAARARLLPRVDVVESVTRTDNPVLVFGGLLAQERFTERDFAVDTLNRPEPLALYRTAVGVRQTLFDAGAWAGLREARLGAALAREDLRGATMDVVAETTRAYYEVQLAAARLRAVEHALETARRSLERAEALAAAGLATEADRLAVAVERDALEVRRIEAAHRVRIAAATLNRILGEPLDAVFDLVDALDTAAASGAEERDTLEALEARALERRPEAKGLGLEERRAATARTAARAAFLPSVRLEAAWESDRRSWLGAGGTNWLVGVAVDVRLFDGGARLAALDGAAARLRRVRAERRALEDAIRLDVRRAVLRRDAAREAVRVGETTVARARESLRIVEARYEAGLADVTELLRAEDALLEAELGRLERLFARRLAEVELRRAVGDLAPAPAPEGAP